MTHPPRVILLPPSADLADAFAQDLVDRHRAELPDLSAVTVVMPSAAAVPHLRRRLQHHAGRGLLGPRVLTLAALAQAHVAEPALTPLECRLLLTEALRRHRQLFPGQDNARVAEALFELFEELTAQVVEPEADAPAFQERLARAYAAPGANAGGAKGGQLPLDWLSREARIVHKLWGAFREDCGDRSPAATHLRGLRAAFADDAAGPVHLLGLDELSRGELSIVRSSLQAGRAELWLAGREHGHDGRATAALLQALAIEPTRRDAPAGPLAELLDAAFDLEPEKSQKRGQTGVSRGNSSPTPFLFRLVEAGGAEHEARCVDVAVRQALLDGAREVVVLTQDRRLARRLRALLERAAVPLQDHAGWALSTSRAAAALDAWLECIEGQFRFRPLLDLLKSGFADVDPDALARLEPLIYREGIDGGINALLAAAESTRLEKLLKNLKGAAFALPRDGAAWPARRWTESLIRSLERIGLRARLQDDAAGAELARLLAQLDGAFARVPLALRWDEFRDLLDGAIERATFAPPTAAGGVRLVTLEQAGNLRCEVLVLAGASREQLPGNPDRNPFFSQSVRLELGLPDWQQRQALALARLRRALDGAGRVVATYASGADDEPAQASPWLEAIEAQALQAAVSLRDADLPRLAASAFAEVGDPTVGPVARQQRPAPASPAALLPERLSATGHQALLDCPYRFFARSVLKLEQEHAPDEDPDRSDYGRRVHRILEAFATQVDGLPPPFTGRITPANRPEAQARLEAIAAAVFERDLATRALALTWAAEFKASIPGLLDWMARRPAMREVRTEVELDQMLDGLRLHGILDRIETRLDGSRVIVDYKAGKVPKEDDVLAGEHVQLLHYALLDPEVTVVEYRPLRDKKYAPVVLEEDLAALKDAARERLRNALARLRSGAPLPAQGVESVCEYCDYIGLCRREDWPGPGPGSGSGSGSGSGHD
jgi:ATP-dependent helicase/nuclease subunit B